MNILLRLAEIRIPGFIRRKKFRALVDLTARAFGVDTPIFRARSASSLLSAYALFTREQADLALRDGRSAGDVAIRLHQNAAAFGRDLRTSLHISTPGEVMRAARLLYGTMGIDFRGSDDGNILIGKCAFSDFYESRTCALISALDEGLLAGLAGGGRLEFSERITDGQSRCRARFHSS